MTILICFLVVSCSNDTENIEDPGQTTNVIWPLKVGNNWTFTVYDANHSAIDNETRNIISTSNTWYEMAISSQSVTSFLSNTDDGLYLLDAASQPQLLLKYPAIKGDQFNSTGAQFTVESTDTVITTTAGTFTCYLYQRYVNGKLLRSNYYAVDIGYIKRINFDTASSNLLSTFELTSYQLR